MNAGILKYCEAGEVLGIGYPAESRLLAVGIETQRMQTESGYCHAAELSGESRQVQSDCRALRDHWDALWGCY